MMSMRQLGSLHQNEVALVVNSEEFTAAAPVLVRMTLRA
jgi:hypothetical protein